MRLVLVGPPGAGKGTQGARLAERLDVPHISTGDLFRFNVDNESRLGMEARKYMVAGELVPDSVTLGMVRNRLCHDDAARGFILDGFPRTVPQADSLTHILARSGTSLDAVVQLKVDANVVLQRMLARGRSDDDEVVIRNRQQIYREETTPLLLHYVDALVSVDAVGAVADVTDRILAALKARPG
ncbi:adenylate kinase [Pseudonocardia sulfidoxydans NBRC 16205]|uniref:Adenylate kinase n=1 Tax=Pseudonocardia sulfidoxydans NBRC 16205 TaxID=1223511 RepID=A0A511DQ49_9PSEU|nr:adenylate kinase [Pseudonocardia sulfidoxydans]GEL26966.1 adenylate kinase [Pseudonocardia sulfidoxydans NBRC 16205]